MGRFSVRGRAALWALGAALAVAVGVALAVRLWPGTVRVEAPADAAAGRASDARPQPAPPLRAGAAPGAHGAASGAFATRPAQAVPLVAGAPDPVSPSPPGVSPADWARLAVEFAARPDELERLRAHFEFADAVRRLRDGVPGSAGQQAAAREVDAGLPARLAARELSAGEARLLKLAVLEVLQPEPAARTAALARWESDAAAARDRAPAAPAQRAAARDAEFLRRQQALVAAWQAQPAAARDPRALERDLERLRRSVYAEPLPFPAR